MFLYNNKIKDINKNSMIKIFFVRVVSCCKLIFKALSISHSAKLIFALFNFV